MKKLAKIVRINFFKTLEINQILQQSREFLFKKSSWISLRRVSLICRVPIIHIPQLCILENQQPASTVKTSMLAATGEGKIKPEHLQRLILTELSWFDLSGVSLEYSNRKAVFIWLLWSSPSVKSLFPEDFCWKYLEAII